jgi:hypothetical protein
MHQDCSSLRMTAQDKSDESTGNSIADRSYSAIRRSLPVPLAPRHFFQHPRPNLQRRQHGHVQSLCGLSVSLLTTR